MPARPFKYLGIYLTMHLDWKYQYNYVWDAVRLKCEQLAQSPASYRQKKLSDEQAILNSIKHSFSVCPYSLVFIGDMHKIRAAAIKRSIRLPSCTGSRFAFLPRGKGGMGHEAMHTLYAQVCAHTLIRSLNDAGRLGHITRALTAWVLKSKKVSLQQAGDACLNDQGFTPMCLRKAAWANRFGLTIVDDTFPLRLGDGLRLHQLVLAATRLLVAVSGAGSQDRVTAYVGPGGVHARTPHLLARRQAAYALLVRIPTEVSQLHC